MKTYCDRAWLNKNDSPSTRSVVAFDRIVKDEEEEYRSSFLQISDCFTKVKLHKESYSSVDDFINKMKKLKTVIDSFINHLEMNKEK